MDWFLARRSKAMSEKTKKLKKRKRLLFTCENRQEVEALVPIANEIEKLSNGQVQCEFISQDAFYCQKVDDALQELHVKIVSFYSPIRLSKPFVFNPLSTKLKVLLITNRRIAPLMEHYDGLVCGVDSALARMLITSAHRLGKPTFQVIVSLLVKKRKKEKTLKSRIKHILKLWLARLTGMNFLALPTGVAKSGCDRIFVMGERVRRVLVQNGVSEERILVYGVPRFERLYRLATPSSSCCISDESVNILYIPGAFAAHGETKQHRLQQCQLKKIVEYILRNYPNRYRLIVKIHPRERKEYYTWMREYEKIVQILERNTDVYQAILDSHMVVTICSTVSYEAVLLNRPVIIARFPDPEVLSYEPLVSDFRTVDSVQELMKTIASVCSDPVLYNKLLKKESKFVYDVIDPKTPKSASLIAQQICADIGVSLL